MAESEVVKAIRKQREEIARNEIDTLKRMAKLWVPSYKYLKKQVDALTALIQQKRDKGEPVEIEYLYSLDRYKAMVAQAKKMIRDYNKAIAGLIRGTEAEMVDIGHKNAKQIINIAEPDDPLWTRVNKRETRIMAAMTADETPLDNLLAKSFGQMKEGMESALITGISTGQGSSWIAQQLMQAAEIPERRALLIARTEVNRTYRQSNWEQMRSSRAILGYRRMCYKDTACFACLMLDKEFYPVDSEPTDHPNGKCSFVPVTRHFDPGADPGWESGRDWFEHQDSDPQRSIMGPGRFDLWKQSGIDPRDMVYIKPNDIWGGSPAVRALNELIAENGNQYFRLSGTTNLKVKPPELVPYRPVAQSAEDLKKFEALDRKLQKKYGPQFALSGRIMSLDYDSVKASLDGVLRIFDELPEIRSSFTGFDVDDDEIEGFMYVTPAGKIVFSRNYYAISTKENLSSRLSFGRTYGLIKKTFDEASIGRHEAGHILVQYCYEHDLFGKDIPNNILRAAVKRIPGKSIKNNDLNTQINNAVGKFAAKEKREENLSDIISYRFDSGRSHSQLSIYPLPSG